MKRISWLLPFLYVIPLLLIGKNGNADLYSELKFHVETAQNTEPYTYPYHDLPEKLKGENRPINNEQDRALMLANMHGVDAVILFDEDKISIWGNELSEKVELVDGYHILDMLVND